MIAYPVSTDSLGQIIDSDDLSVCIAADPSAAPTIAAAINAHEPLSEALRTLIAICRSKGASGAELEAAGNILRDHGRPPQ